LFVLAISSELLAAFCWQKTLRRNIEMLSAKMEALIELYFNNRITKEQKAELAALAADLTDEQIQQLLEKAWLQYTPDTTMPAGVSDNILASIIKQDTKAAASLPSNTIQDYTAYTHTKDDQLPNQRRNRGKIATILLALSAAAAVLIFFITGKGNQPVQKTGKTFISANGERKNFQLPDGSSVTLNGGSKITIGADYGVSNRDIFLNGQAFFDVKHNKEVPFIVHTAGMDIKAVGTAFDVKAYPGEKVTETALINGVVEITLNQAAHRRLTLRPNQKIKWPLLTSNNKKSNEEPTKTDNTLDLESLVEPVTKTDDGYIKETAWKENKLVFTNERFADIAVLLERWYGVTIQFDDEAIRNYRFTGIFEKEELESVLGILKETRHFNYSIEAGEPNRIKLYN